MRAMHAGEFIEEQLQARFVSILSKGKRLQRGNLVAFKGAQNGWRIANRTVISISLLADRCSCRSGETVESALENVGRGVLVNHRLAPRAARVGGDQRAFDRCG